MNKLSKILIALIVGIVMIFGIAGCDADTPKKSQSKDSVLQSQGEELNKEISGKSPEEEETTGSFYTLQEAYDNGWLTQDDIMSIAYYRHGRTYNEEIMSEDYQPAPKTPEVLSEKTELKIKSTAAKEYSEEYDIKYAEADGFTITEYCGTYGNCIAVMMTDNYSGTTGVVWIDSIAGVNFYYGNGRRMKIWRETT